MRAGGFRELFIKTVLSNKSCVSSLLQEVGGGDLTNAVLTMLYHVKEANAIFMTKVGDGFKVKNSAF